MTSISRLRARLSKRIGSEKATRLSRRSRPDQVVDGFILAVGRKWVLAAVTRDGGFFDGHVALRLSDIKRISSDTSFESAFARTQPEWPPSLPSGVSEVDLDATPRMLRSLLPPGRMFSIERTTKYDAQWIGIPYGIKPRWLGVWEVTPQASWHEYPTGYRVRTITMVRVGDSYQRGLAAMAGDPPPEALTGSWSEIEH